MTPNLHCARSVVELAIILSLLISLPLHARQLYLYLPVHTGDFFGKPMTMVCFRCLSYREKALEIARPWPAVSHRKSPLASGWTGDDHRQSDAQDLYRTPLSLLSGTRRASKSAAHGRRAHPQQGNLVSQS